MTSRFPLRQLQYRLIVMQKELKHHRRLQFAKPREAKERTNRVNSHSFTTAKRTQHVQMSRKTFIGAQLKSTVVAVMLVANGGNVMLGATLVVLFLKQEKQNALIRRMNAE